MSGATDGRCDRPCLEGKCRRCTWASPACSPSPMPTADDASAPSSEIQTIPSQSPPRSARETMDLTTNGDGWLLEHATERGEDLRALVGLRLCLDARDYAMV